MAPVVKQLEEVETLETVVAVTAQHREMLDQVLELFNIEPDYDLNIMSGEQSLTDITVRVLEGLKPVFRTEKPDLVLVHGDTSTTFVGALASYYRRIKVGHVEAGLRTGDKYSPFPEEMNRHLTGVLADLNFAPTPLAGKNLLAENVAPENIFVTGNTVIDALLTAVDEDFKFEEPELRKIDFAKRKVVLLTAHRRENLGQPLKNIFAAVREIAENRAEVEVVFPVHLNPAVRRVAWDILGEEDSVHLIEPLPYRPFANLMARSYLVLSDSGGIQEEAPGLGKPVLVLRDTTERPEAVTAGTVKKVGTDRERIVESALKLLTRPEEYQRMASAVNPYGDGRAAGRIRERILYEFGLVSGPGEEYGV